MKNIVFVIVCLSGVFLMNCGGSSATSASPSPTLARTQPTTASAPTLALPTIATGTQGPEPTIALEQSTSAPESTQAPAQPTTASQAATASTTDLQPPSGDPFNVLKNATLAEIQAKSFRQTTTIVSGDGKTSQLMIEYVAPDRIHLVSASGEQIAIKGKGAWVKHADKWQASAPAMADVFFQALSPAGIDELLKTIQVKSVKFLGPELLDGKPMFVYQYETSIDLGGQSIKGTSKMWIGALETRAYRVESISDSIAKPGTQDKTTSIYLYDIPITIEPPL